MRNFIKNISLALCSFVVVLVIIEITLKLIGWGQIVGFLPNEEWGYLMKPSQTASSYGHPVNINGLGLRGPEIDQKKREGVLRILFVGDSITYGGVKIKEEKLFCRIVEYLLNNNDDLRAESINVSAPGWSPQN
ncbi:MAG TPA: hypothetical protein ENH01_13455 [Nitrospirae bacterium]|nr:hypothetical protein [Nitrospirota bacterium]